MAPWRSTSIRSLFSLALRRRFLPKARTWFVTPEFSRARARCGRESCLSPPARALAPAAGEESKPNKTGCRYRTWAELLAALGIDALECPKCAGRMRVLRLVREVHDIRNKLAAMGEPTEPPARAPARGPPYWASRALRIRADADAA